MSGVVQDPPPVPPIDTGALLVTFLHDPHPHDARMRGAGVDTTAMSRGTALWGPATFPDHSAKPCGNPALTRNAMRFDGAARVFMRTTRRQACIGGMTVGTGAPACREDPDTFDIERKAAGHMTMETGIHACVGHDVARLEGEPDRRYDNVLRGFASLPIRITKA